MNLNGKTALEAPIRSTRALVPDLISKGKGQMFADSGMQAEKR